MGYENTISLVLSTHGDTHMRNNFVLSVDFYFKLFPITECDTVVTYTFSGILSNLHWKMIVKNTHGINISNFILIINEIKETNTDNK